MTIDDALHELAARQHGTLAVLQANELGATRAMLRHRLEHGRLLQLTKHVLGVAGAPPTIGQRLMVAVLDAGPDTFLSHSAGARIGRRRASASPTSARST